MCLSGKPVPPGKSQDKDGEGKEKRTGMTPDSPEKLRDVCRNYWTGMLVISDM